MALARFWVVCLSLSLFLFSFFFSSFTNHKPLLSFIENTSTDQWKRLWGFCPGGNQARILWNLLLCVLNASHTSHLLPLSIPDAWHWQNHCSFPRRTYQKYARGSTKSSATVNSRRPNEGVNRQPVRPPSPCFRWGQEVTPIFSPTAEWCWRRICRSHELYLVWWFTGCLIFMFFVLKSKWWGFRSSTFWI